MSAVFKPFEERSMADYSPIEQRRIVDHWLSKKDNCDDWVIDQIVEMNAQTLLLNFRAGDDAENGRLIAKALLALGDRIDEDRDYWEKE